MSGRRISRLSHLAGGRVHVTHIPSHTFGQGLGGSREGADIGSHFCVFLSLVRLPLCDRTSLFVSLPHFSPRIPAPADSLLSLTGRASPHFSLFDAGKYRWLVRSWPLLCFLCLKVKQESHCNLVQFDFLSSASDSSTIHISSRSFVLFPCLK